MPSCVPVPPGKNAFAGSRMLRDLLLLRRVVVGPKHVTTVMRLMGIAALYGPFAYGPGRGRTPDMVYFDARPHGEAA